MGIPMSEDAGDRAADVVDLFARDKAGGESRGIHRVMSLVTKNDKGGVHSTLANALIILAHDPPLAGMLGFNEFTHQHLIMRSPPPSEDGAPGLPGPYPRPWGMEDIALIQAYLQRVWASRFNVQCTEQAMLTEAAHRRFHPICDWLKSLKWDRTHRIDHWLHIAFGCPDDDYHAAIGSKFVIAACRRVRRPGCKFDHLPVLEGPQGIGKSRACKALFGEAWYSDAIPEELGSRDAALALLGIWGLEFAEIQHLIRNEVEVIKAFLSRSTDRYRPPYAKAYIERPRQGVLIGTTNADDYLRDISGNRRIWPVKCEGADVEWVETNREQIWAEAAYREALGEPLWIDDAETSARATGIQAERMTEDVWSDAIRDWLGFKIEVRTPDILSIALNIPSDRQSKREEMRVAAVLTGLGWERFVGRPPQGGGPPRRAWRKKPDPGVSP